MVKRVIVQIQQSTRTALGAVAYYTGGMLIDSGWIRILGSGHRSMKRDLALWNKNKSAGKGFLLIADDAIGGFYVLRCKLNIKACIQWKTVQKDKFQQRFQIL